MKRPWNLSNIPVYSLATYDGERVNMNICTYVSPVSLDPKQYIIAVYDNTQSVDNLRRSKFAVLQMLGRQHIALVRVLGNKSGKHYDKDGYLQRKKLLTSFNNKKVLSACAAWIELEKIWSKRSADHRMFLFKVTRFATNHDRVLMLDDLRERKLVRM